MLRGWRVSWSSRLSSDAVPASAEDHDATMRALLAAAPTSGEVWVFAYGSLIWNRGLGYYRRSSNAMVSFCPGR